MASKKRKRIQHPSASDKTKISTARIATQKRQCLAFQEENQWEGETWYFYVPLAREVTKDHVSHFQRWFCALDASWTVDVEDARTAKTLAKHGGTTGYMAEYSWKSQRAQRLADLQLFTMRHLPSASSDALEGWYKGMGALEHATLRQAATLQALTVMKPSVALPAKSAIAALCSDDIPHDADAEACLANVAIFFLAWRTRQELAELLDAHAAECGPKAAKKLLATQRALDSGNLTSLFELPAIRAKLSATDVWDATHSISLTAQCTSGVDIWLSSMLPTSLYHDHTRARSSYSSKDAERVTQLVAAVPDAVLGAWIDAQPGGHVGLFGQAFDLSEPEGKTPAWPLLTLCGGEDILARAYYATRLDRQAELAEAVATRNPDERALTVWRKDAKGNLILAYLTDAHKLTPEQQHAVMHVPPEGWISENLPSLVRPYRKNQVHVNRGGKRWDHGCVVCVDAW